MKRSAKILSLFLLVGLFSCYEEEFYSNVPEIKFESIHFIDTPSADTLVLSFSFTDGDANIGALENDIVSPHLVFLDANNVIVTEDNIGTLTPPIYTAPIFIEKFIPVALLPGNSLFLLPSENTYPVILFDTAWYSNNLVDVEFNCPGLINQGGELFRNDDIAIYDVEPFENGQQDFSLLGVQTITGDVPTIFREDYYNFVVFFEERVGDDYVLMDFKEIFNTELCDVGNYNSRMPWFDPGGGTSGTITYNIISAGVSSNAIGIPAALLDKTVRLRFYVYDRAGNKSNEAVTRDFILADITQ